MNTDKKTPLAATTDLLLLPDGRILVHNLTPTMAEVLKQLNPLDEQIQPRARFEITHHASRITHHEPP